MGEHAAMFKVTEPLSYKAIAQLGAKSLCNDSSSWRGRDVDHSLCKRGLRAEVGVQRGVRGASERGRSASRQRELLALGVRLRGAVPARGARLRVETPLLIRWHSIRSMRTVRRRNPRGRRCGVGR
jgi:hypothetical protein